MLIFIHACFLLAIAHVISDYFLTSDLIFRCMTNPNTPKKDLPSCLRRAEEAHGLLAGFLVYLVCLKFNVEYAFVIALAETILHILIDHKLHDNKKEYTYDSDQLLHYFCKILFASYIYMYVSLHHVN